MPTEIAHRRTRHAKHLDNGDGTTTAIIGRDMHYEDPDDGDRLKDVVLGWEKVSDVHYRCLKNRFAAHAYRQNGQNWLQMHHRRSGKGLRYSLPAGMRPVEGTNRLEMSRDGIDWTYHLTRRGLALKSSEIAAPLGPRTYSFQIELVGGATVPELRNRRIESAAFAVKPLTVIGANDGEVFTYDWTFDRVTQTMSVTIDDTDFPAHMFPYIIDPSTNFDVAGADDGFCQSFHENKWPPDGYWNHYMDLAFVQAARRDDADGDDYIRIGLLRWDTSSIPDSATVDTVDWEFYPHRIDDDDGDRNVTMDSFAWDETSGDYFDGETTPSDVLSPKRLNTFTQGQVNTVRLDSTSFINKQGVTSVRFHVDGGNPTGENTISTKAVENTDGLPEHRLIVVYTEADTTAPTVSLDTATPNNFDHLSGTATLQATASDDTEMDRVEFYLGDPDAGGTLIGTDSDTSDSTYSVPWNTTTVANGTHLIFARAVDAAGNTDKDSANLTVNNSGEWMATSGGPVPVNLSVAP
ncbi:MAG: Ig-like domain-containing protein [Rubrobacteraceae bacterium]